MLLGHGSVGQFAVAEALAGTVVNAGTVGLTLGQSSSFSIGTETVTGTAAVDVTTAGQITFSIGDETAFGEAFQNLITFSTGSPDLQIWNQTDDSQSVTWVNVEPGSTD